MDLLQWFCARTVIKGVFNNDFEDKTVVKYLFNNGSDTKLLLKINFKKIILNI
jgi:hypothetical protein